MPRLSDEMTEGVVVTWHKRIGDDLKKGDLLAEIETDKATMELEAYKNGTLLYVGAKEGEKIAVNDLLCIIGEKGKVDVNAVVTAAKGGAQATADSQSVANPVANVGMQTSAQKAASNGQQSADDRIKASPLAKKLARETGVDISKVQGSGDNGRIIAADIESFKPLTHPKQAASFQPQTSGQANDVRLSGANVKQTPRVLTPPTKLYNEASQSEYSPIFFSYSRLDSTFALRLATDLRNAGMDIWIDRLDIRPGQPWDKEIQRALMNTDKVLVILSESSVESDNVLNEIYYALDKRKKIIPVKITPCEIPFRLYRLHYIDFTSEYGSSFDYLLRDLTGTKR